MPRPYSQDLRDRVIGAVEAGRPARSAARVYGVSESTAVKWVQRWRRTGSVPAAAPLGLEPSQRWCNAPPRLAGGVGGPA